MRNRKKKIAATILALCTAFSLSACGGLNTSDVTTLVRGNINEIYLGQYDADFLKMVESTEAEAEQVYLDGLEVEAEYFAYYWGIVDSGMGELYTDLDESLRSDIVELYKEIYSHTKFEVQSAAEQSDGSFAVKVLVEPIDIMEQAEELYMNDGYEPLSQFWSKHAETDFSAMTDEEYMAYTHEYGEVIVSLVRDQIPNLGYLEQKSQSIQVEQDEDGLFTINSDDWAIFDSYVISYP